VGRETNKQRREKQANSARERAAIARASQARLDQRRRARTILSSVVAVVVVVAVIAVIAITRPGHQSATGNRTSADPSIVKAVTGVDSASLDTVGQGTADLSAVKAISDAPLTDNGKPELLFVGAEFCPYCAAERWSMIQALSRFGTFKNLNTIESSSTDTYPNTATFSFYKSSYTSQYLSFVPVEDEDRTNAPLEKPTSAENAIWMKYTGGSFPFMDVGGKYIVTNAGFSPGDLSGLTWKQITDDLKDPTNAIAKDILGESNVITAMICKMTSDQPSSVCSASGVTAVTLPTASA
jgi:hypothetical protein